tara:strand:+ start:142 stop:342 length:201 start_codon:yes stop_codon:yes gene_type:complete
MKSKNFESKYLKYKKKYLELKKMQNGDNDCKCCAGMENRYDEENNCYNCNCEDECCQPKCKEKSST